jgi:Rhodopirellula transposase DDE domain
MAQRMWGHITEHWRGKPLGSRAVMVHLLGSPKTRTGLPLKAERDANASPTGSKVSEEELAAMRRKKDKCHGDWNSTILPRG